MIFVLGNKDLLLKSKYYKIGENNIDIYEPNDIYLDKIEPETTLTEFINKCETNGDITVIDQNGQECEALSPERCYASALRVCCA